MMRILLRRAVSVADRWSEWLVPLLLVAATIPPVLIRHRSLTAIPNLNLLDDSWLLDTSYKAAGGIWFGRDVAFTYGPLFQWLSSAPARWIGLSTGAIYATWYTLPLLLVIVATFVAARLLLPEVAPWKRALFILLAVVFWSPPDLRISLCLLAFALFLRMTDSVASGKPIPTRALAAAAACIAAFWISADTGLYTVAALMLCVGATAIVTRPARRMAVFIMVTAGFSAALVLLTNLVLSSPLDFRFWRSSFVIASGYRWFEAASMAKPDKRLVLKAVALGIVIFAAACSRRMPSGPWTRRPAFLLSGSCLAFAILQTALVRSDHGHVTMGIYPVLFLCGAIAMDTFESWLASAVLPVVTVIATFALASAYPLYWPRVVVGHWQQIIHPELSCPAGSQEFDRACFSPADANLLSAVSGFVNSQIASAEPIAVFPYETAFGLTARHQVAGGVLQSYLVNGDYLSDLELAGLRRSNPPLALYFPDGEISVGVDSVPNFTRCPQLWLYLLQHYRAAATPAAGVLGLIRDDGRAMRLSLHEEPIVDPTGQIAVRKRRSVVPLTLRNWPAAGADFLKLRLRVNYSIGWRVRKPSKLALLLSFADATVKTVPFVLEPNQDAEIWIYLWDDAKMDGYFSDDQSQWRSGSAARLVRLELIVSPYDWISVIPNSIVVEGVEAVELQLK